MGTSTRNKGQSGYSPLVPSWLEGEEILSTADGPAAQAPKTVIPQDADPNRFRGPRTSFTNFINSGGRNTNSARSGISNYISRSLGGSSKATQRLGSARGSTARLHSVLNVLSSGGGVQEIARRLSIENLEGLPAKQFFLKIAEFICPDGGPNDEGMVRSSYFEVISDPTLAAKTTEQLSEEDCESVLKNFMSRTIMEHILNDIGNRTIVLPDDIDTVSHIEDTVRQIIKQDVSDAFVEVHSSNIRVTNDVAQNITDSIYHRTFELLEGLGE